MKCSPCENPSTNLINVVVIEKTGDLLIEKISDFQDKVEYQWTNPNNRFDVNGDGEVTPLDALLIMEALRQGIVYNKNVKPEHFYDVNGDGKVDQSDALEVLNHLRQIGPPKVEVEYPWTNPNNRFDVDGDGQVTPLDALLILEALRNGIVFNKNVKPKHFYDVNGDGIIDESDALAVLNSIGIRSRPTPIKHVWTNPVNRFDVNGDGEVTPLDASLILEALRQGVVYDEKIKPQYFYDVNGDGKIDQSDALAVLDYIRSENFRNTSFINDAGGLAILPQNYDKYNEESQSFEQACPLTFGLNDEIYKTTGCLVNKLQRSEFYRNNIVPFNSSINDRAIEFIKKVDQNNLTEKGYIILPTFDLMTPTSGSQEALYNVTYKIHKLYGSPGIRFVTPSVFAGKYRLAFESTTVGTLETEFIKLENSGIFARDPAQVRIMNDTLLLDYARNIKDVIIKSFNNAQNWPNLTDSDVSVYYTLRTELYLIVEIYKSPECGVKSVKIVPGNTYLPISPPYRYGAYLDRIYDENQMPAFFMVFRPVMVPFLSSGVIRYKVMKVDHIMNDVINKFYTSPDLDVNMKVTDAVDVLNNSLGMSIFGSNEAFKIIMLDGIIYDETAIPALATPPTEKRIKDGNFIIYLSKNFRHTRESVSESKSREKLISTNSNIELVEIDFSSCEFSFPIKYPYITSEVAVPDIKDESLLMVNNHSGECVDSYKNHTYDERSSNFLQSTILNYDRTAKGTNIFGNGWLPTRPQKSCWVHISRSILSDIRFRNNMNNLTERSHEIDYQIICSSFGGGSLGRSLLTQVYSGEEGYDGCGLTKEVSGNVLGPGSKGISESLFYNCISNRWGAGLEVAVASIVVPLGTTIKFYKITRTSVPSYADKSYWDDATINDLIYEHESEPEFEIVGPKVVYTSNLLNSFINVVPWVGETPDGTPMNEMFPPSVRTLSTNLRYRNRYISPTSFVPYGANDNEDDSAKIENGRWGGLYVEVSCTNPISGFVQEFCPVRIVSERNTGTIVIPYPFSIPIGKNSSGDLEAAMKFDLGLPRGTIIDKCILNISGPGPSGSRAWSGYVGFLRKRNLEPGINPSSLDYVGPTNDIDGPIIGTEIIFNFSKLSIDMTKYLQTIINDPLWDPIDIRDQHVQDKSVWLMFTGGSNWNNLPFNYAPPFEIQRSTCLEITYTIPTSTSEPPITPQPPVVEPPLPPITPQPPVVEPPLPPITPQPPVVEPPLPPIDPNDPILNILNQGLDILEKCEFQSVSMRLKYENLPIAPVNIYSTYAKYVLRDLIDPSVKGTVIVPVTNWSGLNGNFTFTPCSHWISNTIPQSNILYQAMNADDIVNTSNTDSFISPVMGIGGPPTEITATVPLHDQDGVAGRMTSGDSRCTKTRSELGYKRCVVESIELLLLASKANNLTAIPPYTEKSFDIELIFFDPSICNNLDLVFAVDVSGSMTPSIDSLKTNIDQIIDFVASIGTESSIGLVRYGQSINRGEPIVDLPLTKVDNIFNIGTIKDAISKLISGGATEPHGRALKTSLGLFDHTLQDRRKIVILITDEPFDAGGESLSQLNQEAQNAKNLDVKVFGVQVNRVLQTIDMDPSGMYGFLVRMARISEGAAVYQNDGEIALPLIELIKRLCLSNIGSSGADIDNPNECDQNNNPNNLKISIDIVRKEEPNDTKSYSINLPVSDIYGTIGNAKFWPYNPPPSGLKYSTKPDGVGNWLNYPNVARQGVSMQQSRWEGFKLLIDSPDGSGVIQCSPQNIVIVDGFIEIQSPLFDYQQRGLAEILRCLPEVSVETTDDGLKTTQKVQIKDGTGGYYYFRNRQTCEISDKVWWDASAKDISKALEDLNGIGAGNAIVTGRFDSYIIQYASVLGVIPGIEILSSLTCTDQEITIVDSPPYNYFKPKPPESQPDPEEKCNYCSYVQESYKIRRTDLRYDCINNTKGVISRVSKPGVSYRNYLYKNGSLNVIDSGYTIRPNDIIVLIDEELKDHKKFVGKIQS